ncbi:tetratricopeptide repeat protein [Gaetbulibacter saemankumensis]|uniref:tetratricopeptide repeat protein n=1 Tax=Gaetbulibacter saemankumensis TaxID=311208 RepID=UPI0004018FBF|nr:tetratricopeptide repeat protein [Gaetbulibacter saemankumensis]
MNNFENNYLLGVKSYREGNYENAIYYFEKAMSVLKSAGLPKEFERDSMETGYCNLGNAKKEVSDFGGAIECYKIVLNSNPGRAEYERLYLNLAECCFEIDSPASMETAIKYLNICTSYYPNNVAAFMNKGIAYIKLNDLYNGRKALESAKALGNKDAERFINDFC